MSKIRLGFFLFFFSFMIASNLHINYAGCLRDRYLFFMVASNLHINLFVKLCSLLEGICCYAGCPQGIPCQVFGRVSFSSS